MGSGSAAAPATEPPVSLPTLESVPPGVSAMAPPADVAVTDVHIEHHPDFDRVVYTLAGDGTVFWQAKRVAEAVQHGEEGARVDVDGRGLLQVDIMGTSPRTSSGAQQYAGQVMSPAQAQSIAAVSIGGSVGQITQSFVGTVAPHPEFAAHTITEPTQLAVDIYR
ncbi:hypothetical protein G4X40_19220 [Rhodococcus sp. D2-41]|uniref:AMIN-like domain-containing protein n=1 Tax=Speluncibacter jeojiensis TaxID=2710754 RepID=A0A9X4LYR5_9ACTN|nr:hypothetical protein [Rhodococcus sp. D2-41]MDG3012275.1 hypothetical protein [Rhodococcus sp. D2-41]MDG3014754.1 hypothetical protein [Corynebacteriales bacterium D3-21]